MAGRNIQFCVLLVISVLQFAILSGCRSESGPDDLIPVTGIVFLDDQPLERGIIRFVPQSGGAAFTGTIVKGTFRLQHSQSTEGAKPGQYKLCVESWATPPTMDAAGKFVEGKSAIPSKYLTPETSGLTAAIKLDRENSFRIELKSDEAAESQPAPE